MNITVYAKRYNRTENEIKFGQVSDLAVLGYPVKWTLTPTADAKKITLAVSDGMRVYEDDNGRVRLAEGTNDGLLRTVNGNAVWSVNTYYGDVNKVLRIIAVE